MLLMCCALPAAAGAASAVRMAQATPTPQPETPQQTPAPTSDQPAPPAPAAPAPAATSDSDEPAGNVAKLQGSATVTRNGMTGPLALKDDIFKGDVLQTEKNATLTVTFSDDTTLDLSANSRIVVDNFVYQSGGKDNAALISVTRGTMAFVAAAVARTGNMKIETPTATLGIRGTTGVVEVPEGAGASATSPRNVGVRLYPDADGRVGHIDVMGRDGASLGTLTRGASGFTVRGVMVSGGGMRMTAMPMAMSPQMMARDHGMVQRVHTMQGVGRTIVTQQRNYRLQNPQRPPAFGRPGYTPRGQPGLNPPGSRGQPGLNPPGSRGQPGLPNRPGLHQPGQPGRPGLNQPGRPGLPNPPGQRGNLQPTPGRPGLPNQGGLQRPARLPNQIGQRPGGLPNQGGMQPRPGLPAGYTRPAAAPAMPSGGGGAGGLLNRLGVSGGRLGLPQMPAQHLPGLPRAGQPALPSVQKKLPPVQKLKPLPSEAR
jgi:hypothetical protein